MDDRQEGKTVVFLLMPEFTMLPFAAAIEPLRSANIIIGKPFYKWRIASHNGTPIAASNGIEMAVTSSIAEERRNLLGEKRPAMSLVCGGVNIEQYGEKVTHAWIRESYNRGVAVGGLCTGAHILAEAGILTGKRCTIHWDNIPGFAERFPNANVFADLFEIDSNIYTCAGGTASLDMMLKVICDDHGEAVMNRVCEFVLTDRVRSATDRQRLPLRARLGIQNNRVLQIVELMEGNLSEPLSLIEIADHVDLSRRQIERLFRTEMGRSPARYYLEIRLDRARHLLIQSALPVVEVAVACGFVSASHFSKCYRELYARSPQQERAERKRLIAAAA